MSLGLLFLRFRTLYLLGSLCCLSFCPSVKTLFLTNGLRYQDKLMSNTKVHVPLKVKKIHSSQLTQSKDSVTYHELANSHFIELSIISFNLRYSLSIKSIGVRRIALQMTLSFIFQITSFGQRFKNPSVSCIGTRG